MTIKSKISFYISVIFTILFGIICLFVITTFSNFRKQEFEARLSEKAYSSIKLLIEVKEIDTELLKIIDKNTLNKLYNEKTLIFDADYNLIYSSIDDTKIKWTLADLKYLKKHKTFFKIDGDNEIYGVFYDSNNNDYFALISANDNFGKRKLEFLSYILLFAYVLFTIATWLFTFIIIKKQLSPLDSFHKKISTINEQNLNQKLEYSENSKNEINLLSNEFNFMINRIAEAYQKQKEFTSQASHELRTPLARISAQIENKIKNSNSQNDLFYKELLVDITKINELLNSLLLLSKVDTKENPKSEITRLDEAIFNSVERVTLQYPNFKVNLSIEIDDNERLLEIKCNQQLIEIAFYNLLRNACIYSNDNAATIHIFTENNKLMLRIENNGQTISNEEKEKLFEAFMRGKNAKDKNGLGLGLRIVYRILSNYQFKIHYENENGLNVFVVRF